MDKKYFGSFSLQNTIRKVKENYPECRIGFKEELEMKSVTFTFATDDRKKYGLSENVRNYQFLNGHLILSNGAIDPFKYDKLDALIEQTELEFDISKQRDSIEKISKALNSCQEFHDTAIVTIGNNDGRGNFDIKLILNEVERAYHMSEEPANVHLEKIDLQTDFNNANQYALTKLPAMVQYKILKTTHPGLLTSATEYISGIRSDKTTWKSGLDAYVKPWKKETYEKLGISPFDVLVDIPENRIVGKYAERPMRHLVLFDGSEYAYAENPLEVISYSEYEKQRNEILNNYKIDIMNVCKETGIIPMKAIERMNVYTGKTGPVVLCSPKEAIMSIRMERLSEPLSGVIQKINRAVKLHSHNGGFFASLRKAKNQLDTRRIDINENGSITRIDVDIMNLLVSSPYSMSVGRKREEITDLKSLPLTKAFIETLQLEVEKMLDRPEYKIFKLTKALEDNKFINGEIISDDEFNVYKIYYFPDKRYSVWIDPYRKEIGADYLEDIRSHTDLSDMLDIFCELYESIF